jgi:hypothetical protein
MVSTLDNFLDEHNRLAQWPSKRSVQLEAIRHIANQFLEGSKYSEAELNEEIKRLHTFGDWAIIRREMCDLGYFDRDRNGIVYTRTEVS